jgi:hypothetical protein
MESLLMGILMIAVGVGVCWLGNAKARRRRRLIIERYEILREHAARKRK